jgi:hypothetical protein
MQSDDALLDDVQRETFAYFLHEVNERNGLVADCTRPGWPCSIAATGLGLASYPVGVERGWMTRDNAVARTLAALRFFSDSVQDTTPDATGYKGFYYHFLDMDSGRRTWDSELSTVDSTFLIAGALLAAEYFDRCTDEERRIRALADALYRRMDWRWAQNGGAAVSHGWKPESGFLPYRWQGYCEALLLYALGLGSPTYPLSADAYPAWLSTYDWRELYGQAHVYAGPLFIHQLSHAWVDFRGIRDDYMRDKGIDYFENSRRATLVQARYAIDNPEPVRLLQRQLLGDHGGRRTGACGIRHRGCPAPLPRIRGARRAAGSRRRHVLAVGRRCVAPGGSDKAHGWRSEWNCGINQARSCCWWRTTGPGWPGASCAAAVISAQDCATRALPAAGSTDAVHRDGRSRGRRHRVNARR